MRAMQAAAKLLWTGCSPNRGATLQKCSQHTIWRTWPCTGTPEPPRGSAAALAGAAAGHATAAAGPLACSPEACLWDPAPTPPPTHSNAVVIDSCTGFHRPNIALTQLSFGSITLVDNELHSAGLQNEQNFVVGQVRTLAWCQRNLHRLHWSVACAILVRVRTIYGLLRNLARRNIPSRGGTYRTPRPHPRGTSRRRWPGTTAAVQSASQRRGRRPKRRPSAASRCACPRRLLRGAPPLGQRTVLCRPSR